LSVTVDTFDNGGGEAPGIEIKWQGVRVAFQATTKEFLRKDMFVDASITVTAAGEATFTYDGVTVSATLAGYAGIQANKYMFGARTGGGNDRHWLDDICINACATIEPAPLCENAVQVEIYTGHSRIGGGAPYSGFVGSFTSSRVSFAAETGYNWHPFSLNDFGADITGYLDVAAAGTYTFALNSDDGSLLFIDGSLVVDNGGAHAPRVTIGSANLTAGRHCFEVQFFECCSGESGVDLILPPGVLYGCPPSCKLTCDNITKCNDPGQCAATVSYPPPTSDCDGVMVNCSPASGSFFPVGTTPVNCTAVDVCNGKTVDQCTFTVTVNDCEPPAIICPANITQCNDPGQCSAVATYTVTASDNCDANPAVSCSPPSGSTFPVGTTPVTCTATDASGNAASCSFTVTVKDCEPPKITCPNDIVTCNEPGKPFAVVTFTATATDNCGVATVVCAPPSGSTFPIGTTPVTCTATDTSGNPSTCSFTVTVKDCQGRWTGGGSVKGTATSIGVPVGERVTHGFELHCDPAMLPNNLEVNWKDASGAQHNFHLETLTSGFCTDDPTITPNPPDAFSDTYIGKGTGRLDGNPGATAEWKFTDAGEPGTNDTAQIIIKDGSSTTVLSVSGNLDNGNHQAHLQ
jgi:hypothetical protein